MKNKFTKLLLILAIAIFGIACSNDPLTMDEANNQISFLAEMNATKATDTAFESGDNISVTAYTTDGSIYQSNVSYSYDFDCFTSTSPTIYNGLVSELEFRALYPYVEMSADKIAYFSVYTNQSSGTNYTLSDLMFGYSALTSDESPRLIFDHMLTKIIMNVTSSDIDMTGSSVTLTALTEAECDFNEFSTSAIGSTQTITMASNGTDSYKAIIIPQLIDTSASFGVISTTSGDYELYIPSTTDLQGGSQYTINATIMNGEITLELPLINDWTEGEFGTDQPDVNDDYLVAAMSLSELSASNYPQDCDEWCIIDEVATTADFEGLNAALIDAMDYDRHIRLEFPYLEALPDSAIGTSWWGYYLTSVETIYLPAATTIGFNAIRECTVTDIFAPNAIEIWNQAFCGCNELVYLSLPSAMSIHFSAFDGCDSLMYLDVNSEYFYFFDCVLYDANQTTILTVLPSISGYYEAPTSVKTVDSGAFYNCDTLESIYLPEVTTISSDAFLACLVKSIAAPNVSYIGSRAFAGCTSLTSVDVANDYYIFENNMILTADRQTLHTYLCSSTATSFTASDEIKYIGSNAFEGYNSLTEISLPKVESLGSGAFMSCSDLLSISLPEVTAVGHSCFWVCPQLTSISMPKVTSIDMDAFGYCSSLETLEIATDSDVVIKSIGSDIFYDLATEDITLILGVANSSMVDGLYFNAYCETGDSYTYGPFKSIELK